MRWDGFWSRFSNEFSLEYNDIQAIIKFLVEQNLRSKLGTPEKESAFVHYWVEQHLISKLGTPRAGQGRYGAIECNWNRK